MCSSDAQMARIRGCDGKPASRPVEIEYWQGEKIVYWNCPAHFIPNSVSEWYSYYKYHKDFSGAKMPDLYELPGKFIEAYHYYERCIGEYDKLLSERRSR